jgi:hypothetical protein
MPTQEFNLEQSASGKGHFHNRVATIALRLPIRISRGGKWVAVRPVATSLQRPDAYAQFYCSPCLMAQHRRPQLALPLQDGDVGCRWFGGLGDYLSVRKMAAIGGEPSTISPDCCRYLLLSKNAQDRYDVSLDNEESET